MNKKFIEFAHEVGLPTYNPQSIPTKLEKFAELVAKYEREECIDICKGFYSIEGIAEKCVEGIRSRDKNIESKMTVDSNGTKRWKLNGQLHRVDGPAVEYTDGRKEYWIHGKEYTEEEYMKK